MATKVDKSVLKTVIRATADALEDDEFTVDPADFDSSQEDFEEWLCEELRETATQLENDAETEEEFSTYHFIEYSRDSELIREIKDHGLWENLAIKAKGCWETYQGF